jgi:tetratricopeptide (TPR) repeat protein
MKHLVFFLLLISFQSPAQPGDMFGFHRMEEFFNLSDSISKYPDKHELRWVRLELMFRPNFTMYIAPESYFINPDLESQFQDLEVRSFNNINVKDELDLLINTVTTLNIDPLDYPYYTSNPDGNLITTANMFYKRGQYQYIEGNIKKAFEDFKTALYLDPKPKLKEEICISLAAYYYHLDSIPKKEDLETALSYIDMVTPVQFENEPRVLERYGDHNYDRFEREKISLLLETNQNDRLFNYIYNLSKSHLNYYLSQLENDPDAISSSYYVSSSLATGLDYLKRLFDYATDFEDSEEYLSRLQRLVNEF